MLPKSGILIWDILLYGGINEVTLYKMNRENIMEIIEVLFAIYLAAVICIKSYIWIKCRKKAMGCNGDNCPRCLQCYCGKHNLSPLEEDIVTMQTIVKNKKWKLKKRKGRSDGQPLWNYKKRRNNKKAFHKFKTLLNLIFDYAIIEGKCQYNVSENREQCRFGAKLLKKRMGKK